MKIKVKNKYTNTRRKREKKKKKMVNITIYENDLESGGEKGNEGKDGKEEKQENGMCEREFLLHCVRIIVMYCVVTSYVHKLICTMLLLSTTCSERYKYTYE